MPVASIQPKQGGGATGTWNINISGSARKVVGDNNAAYPAGALLFSGSGRPDSSPNGDTWLFVDSAGGVSSTDYTNAWGIKHQQASNLIEFYGSGQVRTSINLSNGFMDTHRAYGFQKAPAGWSFDANTTSRTLTISLTTHGRPVLLIFSGDLNPLDANAAWFTAYLRRNGSNLATQICECHGNSWNNPFCITFLDQVGAGTYTYTAVIGRGAGTFTLTEGGQIQSPNFVAVEI